MRLPDASRLRVKICGLTEPDQARQAVELGADWIGLNFHPASKRFVTQEQAAALVAALPDPNAAVALFVDRPVDEIQAIVDALRIRVVQLHGDEPHDHVTRLRGDGLAVVRAFRLGGPEDVTAARAWLAEAEAASALPDAILLDARASGQHGGTGASIPEPLLRDFCDRQAPRTPPIILAGGLSPTNVADAVARWRPWMVDVASGVESAPGRKDPAKVAAFVTAARG